MAAAITHVVSHRRRRNESIIKREMAETQTGSFTSQPHCHVPFELNRRVHLFHFIDTLR